ncbi:adhesion G protein-coupled receptor L3 [Ditylenchus destructor]|uniref:Adhesion G protein-coupled receptor L3 n=1 Tax=Ditylenchus destructor TaxID=166010 RepID=A0AAD4MNC7_9BILA|nr:adhesion G protein-coupled receptor L3 [Ditylenchus destructor]
MLLYKSTKFNFLYKVILFLIVAVPLSGYDLRPAQGSDSSQLNFDEFIGVIHGMDSQNKVMFHGHSRIWLNSTSLLANIEINDFNCAVDCKLALLYDGPGWRLEDHGAETNKSVLHTFSLNNDGTGIVALDITFLDETNNRYYTSAIAVPFVNWNTTMHFSSSPPYCYHNIFSYGSGTVHTCICANSPDREREDFNSCPIEEIYPLTTPKGDCSDGDVFNQLSCNATDDTLNVTQAISDLSNGVKQIVNLTSTQVYDISVVLSKISDAKNLDTPEYTKIFDVLDHLLGQNVSTMIESNDEGRLSTDRIVMSVDKLLSNTNTSLSYLNGSKLGIIREASPNCENRNITFGLADFGDKFGLMNDMSSGKVAVTSIEVPMQRICKQKSKSESGNQSHKKENHLNIDTSSDDQISGPKIAKRVNFIIYRSLNFYVGNSSKPYANTRPSTEKFGGSSESWTSVSSRHERCVPGYFGADNSVVMATIEDEDTSPGAGGQQPVMAKIQYTKQILPLHGSYKIAWWQNGQWARTNTCSVKEIGEHFLAECNHLTDFTLLVDGMEADPSLCDTTLVIIGQVLNFGSMVALIVLHVVFVLNRVPLLHETMLEKGKAFTLLKSDIDPSQFLYNLILSLFYFCFSAFSDQGHLGSDLGCKIAAGVTYWLLLTCIFLSVFQALRILKVFVWTVTLERAAIFMTNPLTAYITSFAAPTLICCTLAVFIQDFFYRDDEFCWIRPIYVWFAVWLPITLLIINGLVSITIISLRLFPNMFGLQRILRTGSKVIAKGTRRQTKEKLIAIFLLQFTLGMPWLFMYLTLFAPEVTTWHYLFTVVNGSQGIILLALFVHKQFQLWRRQANKIESYGSSAVFYAMPYRFPYLDDCMRIKIDLKNAKAK